MVSTVNTSTITEPPTPILPSLTAPPMETLVKGTKPNTVSPKSLKKSWATDSAKSTNSSRYSFKSKSPDCACAIKSSRNSFFSSIWRNSSLCPPKLFKCCNTSLKGDVELSGVGSVVGELLPELSGVGSVVGELLPELSGVDKPAKTFLSKSLKKSASTDLAKSTNVAIFSFSNQPESWLCSTNSFKSSSASLRKGISLVAVSFWFWMTVRSSWAMLLPASCNFSTLLNKSSAANLAMSISFSRYSCTSGKPVGSSKASNCAKASSSKGTPAGRLAAIVSLIKSLSWLITGSIIPWISANICAMFSSITVLISVITGSNMPCNCAKRSSNAGIADNWAVNSSNVPTNSDTCPWISSRSFKKSVFIDAVNSVNCCRYSDTSGKLFGISLTCWTRLSNCAEAFSINCEAFSTRGVIVSSITWLTVSTIGDMNWSNAVDSVCVVSSMMPWSFSTMGAAASSSLPNSWSIPGISGVSSASCPVTASTISSTSGTVAVRGLSEDLAVIEIFSAASMVALALTVALVNCSTILTATAAPAAPPLLPVENVPEMARFCRIMGLSALILILPRVDSCALSLTLASFSNIKTLTPIEPPTLALLVALVLPDEAKPQTINSLLSPSGVMAAMVISPLAPVILWALIIVFWPTLAILSTSATFKPTAALTLPLDLLLILVPMALAVESSSLVALTVTAPPLVVTCRLSPMVALLDPICQFTPTAAATPTLPPWLPLFSPGLSLDFWLPLSTFWLALGKSERPDCVLASWSASLPSCALPDALAKTLALLLTSEAEMISTLPPLVVIFRIKVAEVLSCRTFTATIAPTPTLSPAAVASP